MRTLEIICAIFMVIRAISAITSIRRIIDIQKKNIRNAHEINLKMSIIHKELIGRRTDQFSSISMLDLEECRDYITNGHLYTDKKIRSLPWKITIHHLIISVIYAISAYFLYT